MLDLENLEKTLDRIQDWTKTADQKVGILLALETALFSFLFLDIFRWVDQNIFLFSWWQVVLMVMVFVSGLYSFLKLLSAIIPKINKDKHPLSYTYFGDIAKMNLNEYRSLLSKLDKEDYLKEVVNQIFINSKICFKKHSAFRTSLVAFVLFLITVAILVFSKKI